MRRFLNFSFITLLFLATLTIDIYHHGVFPAPAVNEQAIGVPAAWIDKSKFGMNHLVLQGTPFWRGQEAGRLTSHLILLEEDVLVSQLDQMIPSRAMIQALVLGGIIWFQGIEKYFEPWMLEEMYGVSRKYISKQYDYLSDGYTRQVGYHGLHEVGQLLVDEGLESMGCTVVGLSRNKHWVLGRNFDFEGGRIFDSEKIVKWVFPDTGYNFVSIIWAGMVGAVTGVNEHGIYISMNAAGSEDFKRIGTPSTLVLTKVLQFAKNANEALEILKNEQMFITDIFVLLDSQTGDLYRVEKSPEKFAVLKQNDSVVVANHLIDDIWKNDKTNSYRRDMLTSHYRQDRGTKLVNSLKNKNYNSTVDIEKDILDIMRDKGDDAGTPLHLGNRRAIDALIATHSVIYNSQDQVLFVSEGPGVSGRFVGFDLKKSFTEKYPVKIRELPRDDRVSNELFLNIKTANKHLSVSQRLLKKEKCKEAFAEIRLAETIFKEQSYFYETLGDAYACENKLSEAKLAWQKSLDLLPPYLKTVRKLEGLLKK